MREFVFTLEYDPGVDALIDVLIDRPDARSMAVSCSLADDRLWRIDRVSGPTGATDRAKGVLLDEAYDGISKSTRDCDGQIYRDVLEETARSCTVYRYVEGIDRCDAVETIANRYLDGGLLFEVRRAEATERWRVLMQSDAKVGLLYDTLSATLADGIAFSFGHLDAVTDAPVDPFASVSLRPEQRRVLEVAAERGYYETPRGTTLEEIADDLGVPRSTVSYRLRRAEADLVAAFLASE